MDQSAPALHPELVDIDTLELDPHNARLHSERNLEVIGYSLGKFKQVKPIVVHRATRRIIAGNGTLTEALELGATKIVVSWADTVVAEDGSERAMTTEDAAELGILDNRSAELAEWAAEQLAETIAANPDLDWEAGGWEAADFDDFDVDWPLAETHTVGEHERTVGDGSDGDDPVEPPRKLADTFGAPPFSVLDARQGYWQTRKREWLALGIQSEVGRGAAPGNSMPSNKNNPEAKAGAQGLLHQGAERDGMGPGWDVEQGEAAWGGSGTSIFDPVLTELLVRWFSPDGGSVLDPFAGGSVRGIVSAKLGRGYTGVELRPEQVAANEAQAQAIGTPRARWICGDSLVELDAIESGYDMILSCPPYYDLEVYSDLEDDISAFETYEEFLAVYREIIAKAVSKLAPDSFAAWVVGDLRDKKGFLCNFVGDTITAFLDAGMKLYNEAILVTAVGSLPVRVGKQMQSGRKLGKTHQNVLVFYKGDPRKIRDRLGEVTGVDIEAAPEPDEVPAPTVTTHDGVDVLRDDLVPGGSKRRFVERLFDDDAREVIYAGPAYGAAQLALALGAAATGRQATLFLAQRKEPTEITHRAIQAGANIVEVSPGYLTNVKAKAREYADEEGTRQLIPFGFDTDEARAFMTTMARTVLEERDPYDQIWCVAGSSTLARCIIAANEALGNIETTYHVVRVGKDVDLSDLGLGARVVVHEHDQKFEQRARSMPPYPSASWYDAKLWEHLQRHREGRVFAWNVMG